MPSSNWASGPSKFPPPTLAVFWICISLKLPYSLISSINISQLIPSLLKRHLYADSLYFKDPNPLYSYAYLTTLTEYPIPIWDVKYNSYYKDVQIF